MNLHKSLFALAIVGILFAAIALGQGEDQTKTLWGIKRELTAEGGEEYFQNMKSVLLPRFPGTVVSSVLNEGGQSKLLLAISGNNAPEILLVIKHAKRRLKPIEPGTRILFEAIPTRFSKSPFLLTCDSENRRLEGVVFTSEP